MRRGFEIIQQWCSGVAQLRHASLVRLLGDLRFEAEAWEHIAAENPKAKIERGVIFKEWTRGQVVLDAGVSVCHGTVLACGDSARGHGKITVGSQTWIGQYNNLRSCVDSDIFIGANCLISQFCTLVSSNHKVEKGQPIMDQASDPCRLGIRLGDDVWLGAGVTILPGVSIGAGAVIAANSVVMGDVPENEIWAGSPAQAKGLRHGGVE